MLFAKCKVSWFYLYFIAIFYINNTYIKYITKLNLKQDYIIDNLVGFLLEV